MLIFPVITPLCKAMVDAGMRLPYNGECSEVTARMVHVEETFTMDRVQELAEYSARCVREGKFTNTTAFCNIQIPLAPIEPKLTGKAARKAARLAKLGK